MEEKLQHYFKTLRTFSHVILHKMTDTPAGARFDLSLSQLKAISAFKDNGLMTMKDLAQHAMVKLPNMTTMVDSLIKEGIAERKKDDSDRRKVFVALTPRGKKIRKRFLESRRKTALALFSSLDEKDKNNLLQSLDTVCSILEKTIHPGGPVKH